MKNRFLTIGMLISITFSSPICTVIAQSDTQPLSSQEKPTVKLFDSSNGWSSEQAAQHADRYNDSKMWHNEWMKMDAQRIAKNKSEDNEYMRLPFPFMAFNTLEYSFDGLTVGPLPLPKPLVGVGVSRNLASDEKIPEGKSVFDILKVNPVMYLVANGHNKLTDLDNATALSRSHPHYLFQGSFQSESGDIDWVAIHMADGKQIGIVNGRILDLSQGNLIFVNQKKDGSILIHQHRTRLKPGLFKSIQSAIPDILKEEEIKNFLGTK